MGKVCGIYKITSPTGRIYIGQSRNIEMRKRNYSYENCKSQPRIYRSIVKHGWENHMFDIIEECNISDLNERERHWQEFYNVLCYVNGMNCALTNTKYKPKKTLPFSKEHKEKISKANIGKFVSDKTREKLRNANIGKKASLETKNKMSIKRIGIKRSSLLPPKKGMKKEKHPLWGKRHTPETIEKISGRSGSLNSMYRPILNLETGIYYDTLQEAADSVPTTKDWMRGSVTRNLKRKSNFTR